MESQYSEGQKVKFKLKVISELEENNDFEVLDNIKEVEETGIAPSIERYILE